VVFNAVFAKTFDDISIIPTFVLHRLLTLPGWACSTQSACCSEFLAEVSLPQPDIATWSMPSATAFWVFRNIPIQVALNIDAGLCCGALYSVSYWLLVSGE